jgi:hypothetical protein
MGCSVSCHALTSMEAVRVELKASIHLTSSGRISLAASLRSRRSLCTLFIKTPRFLCRIYFLCRRVERCCASRDLMAGTEQDRGRERRRTSRLCNRDIHIVVANKQLISTTNKLLRELRHGDSCMVTHASLMTFLHFSAWRRKSTVLSSLQHSFKLSHHLQAPISPSSYKKIFSPCNN